MCMIDNCDFFYDVWTVKMVQRARKEHRCTECFREIMKGESYEYVTAIGGDGPNFDVFKTCEHCLAARTWLEQVCGGYLARHVAEELRDHWYEDSSYQSGWLGRSIVNMERAWTKRDGMLVDVPVVFPGLPPQKGMEL